MSLVVEFRLSGDPIEITDAAAAVPEATFEIQRWRQLGDRVTFYVWVESEQFDRVTEAFEELSHTEDVSVLNDTGSVRLYSVTIQPHVEAPPIDLLEDGTVTEGYIEPDGLHLTSRIAGRHVITGTWQYLRSHDMEITVDRLSRASDDEGTGRLTDPQFEALVTAYEMGYFDDDTRVTHEEIAEELDISRSSLSSRLRRAERQLVRQQLGK